MHAHMKISFQGTSMPVGLGDWSVWLVSALVFLILYSIKLSSAELGKWRFVTHVLHHSRQWWLQHYLLVNSWSWIFTFLSNYKKKTTPNDADIVVFCTCYPADTTLQMMIQRLHGTWQHTTHILLMSIWKTLCHTHVQWIFTRTHWHCCIAVEPLTPWLGPDNKQVQCSENLHLAHL